MATAAKKTHSSFIEMSDDEKLAYFTEFESVPENSRAKWIKENHHTDPSQFYRDRVLWLKHHPDFQFGPVSLERQARAKKRLRTMRKQQSLKDDPKERQRAQAAHAEVLAAKRASGEVVRGRPLAVRLEQGQDFKALDKEGKRLMLEEYSRLPDSSRRAFREQHNFSQALVNYYRHRPAAQPSTSIATYEATILPAPPRREASLDDAIAAFEVQRDQLSSFIEQLKRMRGPR